jgi:hypothetical protein
MRKVLFATAALCAFPAIASADDIIKAKGITHVVASQLIDVGDIDGHQLGVVRGVGLVAYSDGGVGATSFVAQTDYLKGSGPTNLVYMNFTMPDGSTIWFKCSGSVQVNGDKVDIKGTGVAISGTGRLAGTKADLSWTGQRMQVTPTTSFMPI